MKKFLIKVLQFTLLFILISGCFVAADFLFIGNRYENGYNASIIDKVARMRSLEEPKILLVGDSNLPFGCNSPLLEERVGMPVVNLGTHGGLKAAFWEGIAKLDIDEGDIVVLCYTRFHDDYGLGDPLLAWNALELHTDLWPILGIRHIPAMIKAYPQYYAKALGRALRGEGHEEIKNSSYARSAFNAYGDVVYRPEGETYQYRKGDASVPKISDQSIDRINALHRYCMERGASLVIAGYPIVEGEFTPDASAYDAFEEQLRSVMDCPVISHYTDYFMDPELFYNTNFHLSEEGAVVRTELLAKDLLAYLGR